MTEPVSQYHCAIGRAQVLGANGRRSGAEPGPARDLLEQWRFERACARELLGDTD